MKITSLIARYLLGLIFLVFGLNGFFNFIPQPPLPTGPAGQYISALAGSHYMVPVFTLQLIGSILLLANRYVPLALTVLGPIIVNIVLFHGLMAPSGLPLAVLVVVLWLLVAASVHSAFAGIFQRQVQN